jgi:cytochrome c553
MILLSSGLAGAASPKGVETRANAWSASTARLAALKRVGDPERGKEPYQVCAACHLTTGAGRNDGVFPQLAGQHATVIIKQLSDIRSGVRDNGLMYPYAATLTDPQEIADIAAYVRTLPVPAQNGWGPGKALAEGKRVYEENCVGCHGVNGEGNAEAFFPVLASQHYRYLLRQIIDIREGTRRNANPAMVKIVQARTPAELDAAADYASRLRVPPTELAERPRLRK